MPDLEPHWKRLLDAKLQLDMAWNYLNEVRQDMRTGTVPAPDREFAYKRALDGKHAALEAFTRALNEFQSAALPEDQGTHVAGGAAG